MVKVDRSFYLKFSDVGVIFLVVLWRLRFSAAKRKGCDEIIEALKLGDLLQLLVINLIKK